jgi:FMN phosphatase YigB (HAD superfamily)
MKLNEKLILVDCDGVLLDWQYSFYKWMEARGHTPLSYDEYDMGKVFNMPYSEAKQMCEYFNTSAAIGWLTPFRDAVKYVRKLHEDHGYVFHCITSLSTDKYAGKLRKKNLEAIFGKKVFEEVICLECGGDKDEALEPYRDTGCVWVEDKESNADLGIKLGLNSMLIEHGHNKNYAGEAIKVANWKEIYDLIV